VPGLAPPSVSKAESDVPDDTCGTVGCVLYQGRMGLEVRKGLYMNTCAPSVQGIRVDAANGRAREACRMPEVRLRGAEAGLENDDIVSQLDLPIERVQQIRQLVRLTEHMRQPSQSLSWDSGFQVSLNKPAEVGSTCASKSTRPPLGLQPRMVTGGVSGDLRG
jgi:hypothetical protein